MITLADRADDLGRKPKVGLSRALDAHGGHEGLEPFDGESMSQSGVDADIGDKKPLPAEANADPAADTGHEGTKSRSGAPIENPYGLAAQASEHGNQPQDVEPAFKLGATVFEIERLCNAGFGLQQVASVSRGKGQEGDGILPRGCSNRANKRQMPNDIANSLLGLDDDCGSHAVSRRMVAGSAPSMRIGLDRQ